MIIYLTLVKYMKACRISILDGRHCALELNPILRFILTGENSSINNFMAAISHILKIKINIRRVNSTIIKLLSQNIKKFNFLIFNYYFILLHSPDELGVFNSLIKIENFSLNLDAHFSVYTISSFLNKSNFTKKVNSFSVYILLKSFSI